MTIRRLGVAVAVAVVAVVGVTDDGVADIV
jgi:hypothetical protein